MTAAPAAHSARPLPPPSFRASPWLPGGHAQTLWPLLIKGPAPAYRRERWDSPDGDFIDLDWLDPTPAQAPGSHDPGQRPLVVLFHGLEGSSRSHYAIALMDAVAHQGWGGVVPHFRGCSGELNRRPRAYHSGDSEEIDWILQRLHRQHPHRPLLVCGVSLGGNALLKWLGEREFLARQVVTAAAAICAPLDLQVTGHHLARGFNRLYTRHFLGTLKQSALARLDRFPGLFDAHRVVSARTLFDFDDAVTAPLHGFAGADDYWTRASAKPLLPGIQVPTLIINPLNDPFLPARALPRVNQLSPRIVFETPRSGGHVGFVRGMPPGHLRWLPQRLLQFFTQEVHS